MRILLDSVGGERKMLRPKNDDGHEISTLVSLTQLKGTRFVDKAALKDLSKWAQDLGEAILDDEKAAELDDEQKMDLRSIRQLAGVE